MKASRLLHLLMLLQTRQRISTTELAETLEVSKRTILRDVDALSMAGVPVYAERGRHGGIALLPGARLNIAHLEPPELEALSVTGLDSKQLELLGLASVHETATRKVALKQAASAQVESLGKLSELLLVDSTAWFQETPPQVDVTQLATDLRYRRQLQISYRRSAESLASTLIVDPYGLVAKSGRWYLIADAEAEPRMLSLERLAGYQKLECPAKLREGQNLRSVWEVLKEHTESPGIILVSAKLRTSRLDLARRIMGNRITRIGSESNGWTELEFSFHHIQAVRQLLQFADQIEVLAPADAKDLVHELACDLALRHAK